MLKRILPCGICGLITSYPPAAVLVTRPAGNLGADRADRFVPSDCIVDPADLSRVVVFFILFLAYVTAVSKSFPPPGNNNIISKFIFSSELTLYYTRTNFNKSNSKLLFFGN